MKNKKLFIAFIVALSSVNAYMMYLIVLQSCLKFPLSQIYTYIATLSPPQRVLNDL
jgi:hypothetical protein